MPAFSTTSLGSCLGTSPGTLASPAERSERTRALLREARATDDDIRRRRLLDEVVEINIPVARALAARYRERGVALEDLEQAACEGLIKAVRRFDAAQAEDLLTFAVPTIRGELQRYFRDRAWSIRPPRRLQDLQARVNAAIDELCLELGREPDAAEVQAHLGITEEQYREVHISFGCFRPTSLHRPVGGADGEVALGDLLPNDFDDFEPAEARCLVAPALAGLSRLDQLLIRLAFSEGLTQREIGERLGMTQSKVSRRLDRVLTDLRLQIGSCA